MGKELENILKAIGRTPPVKLNSVTRGIKSTVFVKTEMLNPGGSVKDRIGLAMVEAAEREEKFKNQPKNFRNASQIAHFNPQNRLTHWPKCISTHLISAINQFDSTINLH
jgi:hypothetical protein